MLMCLPTDISDIKYFILKWTVLLFYTNTGIFWSAVWLREQNTQTQIIAIFVSNYKEHVRMKSPLIVYTY